MKWGKIEIENTAEASGIVNEIQKDFDIKWHAHSCPERAALFTETDSLTRNRTIVLSPEAVEVSDGNLAGEKVIPCNKPELKSWLSDNPAARKYYEVTGTDR